METHGLPSWLALPLDRVSFRAPTVQCAPLTFHRNVGRTNKLSVNTAFHSVGPGPCTTSPGNIMEAAVVPWKTKTPAFRSPRSPPSRAHRVRASALTGTAECGAAESPRAAPRARFQIFVRFATIISASGRQALAALPRLLLFCPFLPAPFSSRRCGLFCLLTCPARLSSSSGREKKVGTRRVRLNARRSPNHLRRQDFRVRTTNRGARLGPTRLGHATAPGREFH